MKRAIILVAILFLACESQTFFERLASEYAPYENIGNSWEFVVSAEDTFNIQWTVTGDTILGGVNATVVKEEEDNLYFSRQPDGLYEWNRATRKFSDEVITLEERWRKRIELPLATGNRWTDFYRNEVDNQGLTYEITSKLEGEVIGIESVLTQADYFENAFRVDLRIESHIMDPISGETDELTLISEWYAPDVGLVRRDISGSQQWILRNFQVVP